MPPPDLYTRLNNEIVAWLEDRTLVNTHKTARSTTQPSLPVTKAYAEEQTALDYDDSCGCSDFPRSSCLTFYMHKS